MNETFHVNFVTDSTGGSKSEMMELAPLVFSRFDYIRDYRFLDHAPNQRDLEVCMPTLNSVTIGLGCLKLCISLASDENASCPINASS